MQPGVRQTDVLSSTKEIADGIKLAMDPKRTSVWALTQQFRESFSFCVDTVRSIGSIADLILPTISSMRQLRPIASEDNCHGRLAVVVSDLLESASWSTTGPAFLARNTRPLNYSTETENVV